MKGRYNKRAFAHNYFAPFIYHIILSKKNKFPIFGTIKGDARIPYGHPGCAEINENEFGHIISKSIIGLPKKFPIIQVYRFQVMPDHVHILLRIKSWSENHLDFYIETLMTYIAKNCSKISGRPLLLTDVFEEGYCDKPLLLGISLNGWYKYIQLNPHRLAMRIQYPKFFQRTGNLKIGDKIYEAYGNLFLLSNPDKSVIKLSRSFSEEKRRELKKEWEIGSWKGQIMVSPFISTEEKQIREMIEQQGGKIILITHEIFRERYKPTAHNFELCCKGNLLIISMGYPLKSPLTREICNEMNKLALEITKGDKKWENR